MAAPAQAAAQSSAQPPAQRPQAGNGMKYFTFLGNFCGRWSTVDGDWRRSSKSGQRFMRSIPRCYERSDEHEETRLALLAHTEYWMGQFLDARNLSQKFILASKSEIDPRLSEHMPMRAMFYRMQHLKRPPPRRTAMTRFYFHGTFPHTVWPISDSEQFMDSINGSPEGHEASTPGVYASDRFEYGIGHYGWPSNLFRDGMFYRCGFVIQAEHDRKRHEKNRGTLWHEIVFSEEDVYIVGLVVLPDSHLEFGHARFYEFNLDHETRPRGALTPRVVEAQIPLRHVEKWGY